MEAFSVYKDMQSRTNGEIYIGVVGPVRTGREKEISPLLAIGSLLVWAQ